MQQPLTFYGLLLQIDVSKVSGESQRIAIGTGLHARALQRKRSPGWQTVQAWHDSRVELLSSSTCRNGDQVKDGKSKEGRRVS